MFRTDMFFFFSNRLGCLGFLLIFSAITTVALLFVFGMLRLLKEISPRKRRAAVRIRGVSAPRETDERFRLDDAFISCLEAKSITMPWTRFIFGLVGDGAKRGPLFNETPRCLARSPERQMERVTWIRNT
jgi:hypothetical protein